MIFGIGRVRSGAFVARPIRGRGNEIAGGVSWITACLGVRDGVSWAGVGAVRRMQGEGGAWAAGRAAVACGMF